MKRFSPVPCGGYVLTIAVLWIGACRSAPDRLTYDNYARVTPYQSTQGEVSSSLGEPTSRLGQQWIYERPQQHLYVFIDFDDQGRVTRKQWVDAPSGKWDDTRESSTSGSNTSPGARSIRATTTHKN